MQSQQNRIAVLVGHIADIRAEKQRILLRQGINEAPVNRGDAEINFLLDQLSEFCEHAQVYRLLETEARCAVCNVAMPCDWEGFAHSRVIESPTATSRGWGSELSSSSF